MIRILIADDDEIFGENLKEILQRHGYDVARVTSGRSAIERLQEESFDLLLLDLVMPQLNGITTTQDLRKQKIDIRIIIMTAYASREISDTARESGVQGFIKKPFEIPVLLNLITSSLPSASSGDVAMVPAAC
ncbi:MAG: response regulator [Magnetococcales bacterium]|nr:response regulator [Magnetococcales bacterium]